MKQSASSSLSRSDIAVDRRRFVHLGAAAAGTLSMALLGACAPVSRERAQSAGTAGPAQASTESWSSQEDSPDICILKSDEPPTEEIGAIYWEAMFEFATAQLQERLKFKLRDAGDIGAELASSLYVTTFFYFYDETPRLDPRSELQAVVYEVTMMVQDRLIEEGLPEDQARRVVISNIRLYVPYEVEIARTPGSPAGPMGRLLLRPERCTTYTNSQTGSCIRSCTSTSSC